MFGGEFAGPVLVVVPVLIVVILVIVPRFREGRRRQVVRRGRVVERAEADGQARALLDRRGERPGGLLMRGRIEALLRLQRLPAFAMAGKRAFGPVPPAAHGLGQRTRLRARLMRLAPLDLAELVSCATGQSRARVPPAGFTSPVISAWKRSTRSIVWAEPEATAASQTCSSRASTIRASSFSVRFHERRMRRRRSTI